MNIKVNDILVFKKKEYLVLEVIDNRYLYLINNDHYQNDTAIVKIVEKYGNTELNNIDNDDEFNYAINKLYIKYKDDILKYIKK